MHPRDTAVPIVLLIFVEWAVFPIPILLFLLVHAVLIIKKMYTENVPYVRMDGQKIHKENVPYVILPEDTVVQTVYPIIAVHTERLLVIHPWAVAVPSDGQELIVTNVIHPMVMVVLIVSPTIAVFTEIRPEWLAPHRPVVV